MANKSAGDKLVNKIQESKKYQQMQKLGLYLTPHALMGYHNIIHYLILGSRGRGKSVISLDAPLAAKKKYGYDNVKIFYFRISDLSVKAMLANKASKAIDPILVHKYNLDITTKVNTVYDHGKELIQFYPLVSAGKVGKGVNLYDADYLNNRPLDKNGKPIKRFIYIILDEFLMAEGVEKRSVGNPVDQWLIYLESILRDQQQLDYDAVKIFYLANAVSECASFMGQLFNYIPTPGDFGIKKLTRKHCLVWNVPNSQQYIDKRKKSYTADILDYENDANYTNVVKRDLETIMKKNRRLIKVTQLIMFSKDPKNWFCVYDGKYIRKYHNEQLNKNLRVPMIRHLDSNFNEKAVKNIFEMYDARAYMFADLISQASFSAKMKELKNK